jgi:hypothetical protein
VALEMEGLARYWIFFFLEPIELNLVLSIGPLKWFKFLFNSSSILKNALKMLTTNYANFPEGCWGS